MNLLFSKYLKLSMYIQIAMYSKEPSILYSYFFPFSKYRKIAMYMNWFSPLNSSKNFGGPF